MQVLDDEQHRRVGRDPMERVGDGIEQQQPVCGGIVSRRRSLQARAELDQLGEHADERSGMGTEANRCARGGDIGEMLAERDDEGLERPARLPIAAPQQDAATEGVHVAGHVGGQPALPDPRFAPDEHDPPLASRGQVPRG